MKLAIGYSTKDQVEITEQTLPRILLPGVDVYWGDGSTTGAGRQFLSNYLDIDGLLRFQNIRGGADAAIAWKLSKLLNASQNYTHIGLLENDVLLDEDWFEPTMQLFEKGKQDGLEVGSVSARSYVDRVLIQRNGWAVMHNLGAGMVIFTREAADIVLRAFRTHWWPDNRRLFANLSGIDLATYAAFKGNEQWVSTDWGWDAQLARHGLASLALTPAKCQMIGQKWPLEQQGLELTTKDNSHCAEEGSILHGISNRAFKMYRDNLARLGPCIDGIMPSDSWSVLHRDGAGLMVFPHQLGYLAGAEPWQGTTELQWNQGFGPFVYRAGPGGASLSVRISGICSFLASGGNDGARVAITDTRSGFNFAPSLPAGHEPVSLQVPGGPISRRITIELAEGAVFHGLATNDPQLLDTTFKFDWSQLPRAT